jgi:hypothetical protein
MFFIGSFEPVGVLLTHLSSIPYSSIPFMIYYPPILLIARKRTSKHGSDGPESGRWCKLRPGASVEWTLELQGEPIWK